MPYLCEFEFYVSYETRAPHLLRKMFTEHFSVRLFRFMRQRYGTVGDWEKTQKRGSGKNAKSTPPVFVILTIEVLYQFFAVVSEFVVCFFEE